MQPNVSDYVTTYTNRFNEIYLFAQHPQVPIYPITQANHNYIPSVINSSDQIQMNRLYQALQELNREINATIRYYNATPFDTPTQLSLAQTYLIYELLPHIFNQWPEWARDFPYLADINRLPRMMSPHPNYSPALPINEIYPSLFGRNSRATALNFIEIFYHELYHSFMADLMYQGLSNSDLHTIIINRIYESPNQWF